MKQIIPFKKELPFKTKVCDITSISLERDINIEEEGIISGEFHITGDYKMNEGSINRENFSFDLPFDISLDPRYDVSTVKSDIEDFYYDIINEDTLKVNIDLFVEADYLPESEKKESLEEKRDEVIEEKEENADREILIEKNEEKEERDEIDKEEIDKEDSDRIDKEELDKEDNNLEDKEEVFDAEETVIEPSVIFEETVKEELPTLKNQDKKEDDELPREDIITASDLFSNLDDTETYTTYYVYIVKEDDTIDKILSLYDVSKEDLENYNDITEIKPGDKVIIPAKCE